MDLLTKDVAIAWHGLRSLVWRGEARYRPPSTGLVPGF
jgi:hypothetical protein